MCQINVLIRKIDNINKDIKILENDQAICIDGSLCESSRRLVVAAGINILNSQRSNLLQQLRDTISVNEYS